MAIVFMLDSLQSLSRLQSCAQQMITNLAEHEYWYWLSVTASRLKCQASQGAEVRPERPSQDADMGQLNAQKHLQTTSVFHQKAEHVFAERFAVLHLQMSPDGSQSCGQTAASMQAISRMKDYLRNRRRQVDRLSVKQL